MKKKVLIVILVILGFFVIDIFILDLVLDKKVDETALRDTIKTSLNCEQISFDISGKGLAIKHNVYGDYQMVVLTNCDKINNDDTIIALHKALQSTVKNFCELDLLQLTFINQDRTTVIAEIRNCELTLIHP